MALGKWKHAKKGIMLQISRGTWIFVSRIRTRNPPVKQLIRVCEAHTDSSKNGLIFNESVCFYEITDFKNCLDAMFQEVDVYAKR